MPLAWISAPACGATELAHRAVDRETRPRSTAWRHRAHAGSQLAREKCVERFVQRTGRAAALRACRSADRRAARCGSACCARRLATARQRVHAARQQVLRQHALQQREQFVAARAFDDGRHQRDSSNVLHGLCGSRAPARPARAAATSTPRSRPEGATKKTPAPWSIVYSRHRAAGPWRTAPRTPSRPVCTCVRRSGRAGERRVEKRHVLLEDAAACHVQGPRSRAARAAAAPPAASDELLASPARAPRASSDTRRDSA